VFSSTQESDISQHETPKLHTYSTQVSSTILLLQVQSAPPLHWRPCIPAGVLWYDPAGERKRRQASIRVGNSQVAQASADWLGPADIRSHITLLRATDMLSQLCAATTTHQGPGW